MSTTVTLRRAAKIRNRLTQHLAELRSKLHRESSIIINVYDENVPTKVAAQTQLYNSVLSRFIATSEVLYSIRDRIDIANAETGINSLLARQNQLKGQLTAVLSVANTTDITPSDRDIGLRLQGIKERNAVATYGKEETSISCISQFMVSDAKNMVQTIQTLLDGIQDQLESLNANRTIEITPSELALLQTERLI